ncbi:MAG: hypothetical protein ACLP00_03040 [Terracidiphilus sp.]
MTPSALFTIAALLNRDKHHRLHTLMHISGWAVVTLTADELSVGPLPTSQASKPNAKHEAMELQETELLVNKLFVNTKALRAAVDDRLEALAKGKRDES